MKSPLGLIWNTPNRRKRFERDDRDLRGEELELLFLEMEAAEARSAGEEPARPRLRLL